MKNLMFVLVALFAINCSSSDGGKTSSPAGVNAPALICGSDVSCGGDLSGEWLVTETCMSKEFRDNFDKLSKGNSYQSCVSSAEMKLLSPGVVVTFPNGNWFTNDSIKIVLEYSMSEACLQKYGKNCAVMGTNLDCSLTNNDLCTCATIPEGTEEQESMHNYCVQGDTLVFSTGVGVAFFLTRMK